MSERPSALYLASSIDHDHPEHSGWVELDYGVGGNVTSVTVHGQCRGNDAVCEDPGGSDIDARRAHLRTTCACASEQHYQYRWDELNRISEARRFDREGGLFSNGWTFEARQRYRYDGANVRVIKQSFDTSTAGVASDDARIALYVYPGDFERRGLTLGAMTYGPTSDSAASTETQYLVAGARMVWQHGAAPEVGTELDRHHRITIPVGDLLHTTAASADLLSGELLEVSTYYPNGARETLLVEDGGEGSDGLQAVPLEPMGFTGKEADEDVGLVYFGERYLIARVGRWASADPLSIAAASGGQPLNGYHYVGGNVLTAHDPLGMDIAFVQRTTDIEHGAEHQALLAQSAVGMVRDMREELWNHLAIGTIEVDAEGATVAIRPSGGEGNLDDTSSHLYAVRAAVWNRAIAGEDTPEARQRAQQAVAAFDQARERMLGYLRSGASLEVQLTTRADASVLPLAGAEWSQSRHAL